MAVQPAGKIIMAQRCKKDAFSLCCCVWLIGLLGVVLLPGLGSAAGMRKELQRSYETYKQSALHYKVFALKHEGDKWDGWYTWGYNDLDQAILDAVQECNKGSNVAGKCQVYSLGNEVVVGLEPLQLQGKIEEYRIRGMVNRSFPQPAEESLIGLGFSGDGQYFAGVLPGKSASRLFLYDSEDQLWKHTFVLKTDLPLYAGRSFSLSHDGRRYAYARYAQSAGDRGESTVLIKGWREDVLAEIPLDNGAFWNGGCGLALSPTANEVAVCVDDGVTTRVLRYEINTGKKLGAFDSAPLKGKFDQSLAYSADGKFLLVQGGRYQFDWVMKKKGKEAELAWVFNIQTGHLQKSLEFLLAPGRKGPEDVRFSLSGHEIVVTSTNAITVHSLQGEKKIFPHESGAGAQAALSPHGVLAVADNHELSRYSIDGNKLRSIDSVQAGGSSHHWLGFDRKSDRWILALDQDIMLLPAFRQLDLKSLALYTEAKEMFARGSFKEAAVALSQTTQGDPRLPAGLSMYSFYMKYPDAPLADFGNFYVDHVKKILDTSPKVSRLGFGYIKDLESGLFFTTVKRIDPGTSVARSALKVGDRITHVNGTPVVLSRQINDLLETFPPGDRVELTFMRNGRIAKSSVITEVGFKDTGKAAQVLLTLFDYGQLAAQAGHSGLARLAAVRLREISSRYPSSFRIVLVEKVAVSLEALAFAVEGDMETGFDLLAESAPHPFQFRLFNPLVWGEFYADRQRMAEVLGISEAKLPQFDGVMSQIKQDYPDLNGTVVPAVMTPPLLR
ncbi:MAG: PDZ domain-containing protein [Spirochaetales bacterium]|nr:PDZ domain-containing protein [Spirochaetales bacterium]